MKTNLAALVLAAMAISGCGPDKETRDAIAQRDFGASGGPLPFGLWPGEPRSTALRKARTATDGRIDPSKFENAAEVTLEGIVIAETPATAHLYFHDARLASVRVHVHSNDRNKLYDLRSILRTKYGEPTPTEASKITASDYWRVLRPLPFSIIASARGGLGYDITYLDGGPLGLAAAGATNAEYERGKAEAAKKSGL